MKNKVDSMVSVNLNQMKNKVDSMVPDKKLDLSLKLNVELQFKTDNKLRKLDDTVSPNNQGNSKTIFNLSTLRLAQLKNNVMGIGQVGAEYPESVFLVRKGFWTKRFFTFSIIRSKFSHALKIPTQAKLDQLNLDRHSTPMFIGTYCNTSFLPMCISFKSILKIHNIVHKI